MPDISPMPSLTASQLLPVDAALAGLFPLSPPPTPKGRYALSRAAKVIGPAVQTYRENHQALLVKHAVKDADGKPVTQDLGKGLIQYDLGAGFGRTTPAFDADLKALGEEVIDLTGCRMISHAELGDCPITVQQETALLGVLLIDAEPE